MYRIHVSSLIDTQSNYITVIVQISTCMYNIDASLYGTALKPILHEGCGSAKSTLFSNWFRLRHNFRSDIQLEQLLVIKIRILAHTCTLRDTHAYMYTHARRYARMHAHACSLTYTHSHCLTHWQHSISTSNGPVSNHSTETWSHGLFWPFMSDVQIGRTGGNMNRTLKCIYVYLLPFWLRAWNKYKYVSIRLQLRPEHAAMRCKT
jgi:hypothetical protein